MATQPPPVPIDAALEAGELADHFRAISDATDEFRLRDHDPPIPPAQLQDLKEKAQELQSLSFQFTAESVGATLQSIQPDLERIKTAATKAKDQLRILNSISEAISIVGAAVEMGTAIVAAKPASIGDALKVLE
jgi:hypothetical protein